MATLARWCFRHRLLVLLMWLVTLGGVAVASQSAGSAYASVFHVPDTESGKAQDLVKAAFPESAGDMDTVVWRVDEGTVRDAAVRCAAGGNGAVLPGIRGGNVRTGCPRARGRTPAT